MGGRVKLPTNTHRAAIAGKVRDAVRGRPIAGAIASILAGPRTFQRALEARRVALGDGWDDLDDRPDRARTSADGCFRLIDLPDGDYQVTIAGPRGAGYASAQCTSKVARDAQGHVAVPIADIALTPTGVRGVVQGPAAPGDPNQVAIALARIRVRGSGEAARTDERGRFVLLDVDPGERQLDFSAQGRAPATVQTSISAGAVTDAGTIVLQPSPP